MNLKNMKKFIKTNKTTPPINLGVWLFFMQKNEKKFIKSIAYHV